MLFLIASPENCRHGVRARKNMGVYAQLDRHGNGVVSCAHVPQFAHITRAQQSIDASAHKTSNPKSLHTSTVAVSKKSLVRWRKHAGARRNAPAGASRASVL
eukprot:591577-Pleurochrysis_carterae.AAC.2